MEVRKERSEAAAGLPGQEELEAINRFAKTPLAAEQVYTFTLRLCDNEVDRDFERFDSQALEGLGGLFLGKSGIFDHQWSAQGQTARIYRTEVVREPSMTTAAGDEYRWLKGWAYLLRTEKNAELIAEIEGGIKKEVSVGCSVKHSVCSICGGSGGCQHVKGQVYDGKLCFTELREPADAYEWSFVAVPAQRRAGVVKSAGQRQAEEARLGRKYLKSLRREMVRLAGIAEPGAEHALLEKVAGKLDEEELLGLIRLYRSRADNLLGSSRPQFSYSEDQAPQKIADGAFLI